MIEILIAQAEHYPIIQDIAYKTWQVTYSPILSPEQMTYMLEWMYSVDSICEQVDVKGHYFIMARLNNLFVGFASYELNYQDSAKTRIHKIYVLPDMQGAGVGKALMDVISEAAIKVQNTKLNLNVNRFNKSLIFYQKIGFEIVAEEDIDIGRGYLMEDYIMEKILPSH